MDLDKVYHDSEGNERNIYQMVKQEPEWACNVIQQAEAERTYLKELQKRYDLAFNLLYSAGMLDEFLSEWPELHDIED